MIVGYFDLLGSCIGPPKDDPPLIIDTDRMFALPIALQRLKSIARRNPKVAQSSGAIDLDKLHKLEGQFGVPKLDIDLPKTPAQGTPK